MSGRAAGSGSSADQETTTELVASRARVLAGADDDRRRLQRDLHDGAQQRLVHATIALKLARGALAAGSPEARLIEEALTNVERASRDLRALVHRLLPRALAYGGLAIALESLVDDLAVPVGLRVTAPRLPTEVETTAYLAVAEALGVVGRRGVRRIDLEVGLEGDVLTVDLRHDRTDAGPGAVDTLVGVEDRVRTAGGSLTILDAAGSGSVVRIRLPVQADGAATV